LQGFLPVGQRRGKRQRGREEGGGGPEWHSHFSTLGSKPAQQQQKGTRRKERNAQLEKPVAHYFPWSEKTHETGGKGCGRKTRLQNSTKTQKLAVRRNQGQREGTLVIAGRKRQTGERPRARKKKSPEGETKKKAKVSKRK